MTIANTADFSGLLPRSGALPVLAAVVGGLLLAGCEKAPVEQPPVVRPVKVFKVGDAAGGSVREYPGTIRATQNVEMAFEVPGRIIDFPVKEGDWVDEGKVLARLDARDYEANFDTVKAELRKALADQKRGLSIFKEDSGAISRATLDADKREVEVAQAKMREADKSVEDTVLRAPFDGRMARKLVEDFANVNAKQPVLIFQDSRQLEISVNIPERDFTGVTRGRTVEDFAAEAHPEVMISAIPDRTFPATVKEYATTADPVTRTFEMRLTFESPEDVQILPGTTAKIRALAGNTGVLRVPAVGVRADPDKQSFVWKLDGDSMTVGRIPVELGELSGADVQILGGLQDGQEIVVSGLDQLREGMEVRRYGK